MSAPLRGVDGVVHVDKPDDPFTECQRSCQGNQFLFHHLCQEDRLYFLWWTHFLWLSSEVQGLAARSSLYNATLCCSFLSSTGASMVS